MTAEQFEYITICANPHPHLNPDPIAVYGISTYPEWSVLGGQTQRVFLDSFQTVEEARAAYPTAEEAGLPARAQVPVNPPSDFDPLDAGEAWGEDDY